METLLEQAEKLQNLLVARATASHADDAEYRALRQVFLSDANLWKLLPPFVKNCRSVDQFWEFIKHKFRTYAERRRFIWDPFAPLISHLETANAAPLDSTVARTLKMHAPAHVHAVWSKALDRRKSDPQGAITLARTLLESVCRHILDDVGQACDDKSDQAVPHYLAGSEPVAKPAY